MTHEEYANSLRQIAAEMNDAEMPPDAAIAVKMVMDAMNRIAERLSPTFTPQHTQQEILDAISHHLPFPPDALHVATPPGDHSVRFTWEGKDFRVSHCMGVEEVDGAMLKSNGIARLVANCLQQKL